MIKLVEHYLFLNGYSIADLDFEDSFQSHPNYPSLYALTDTFDLLHIDNVAAKVDKDQFHELPDNFLSVADDQFVLITKNNSTVILQDENLKKTILSIDDFVSSWSGIVVAVEQNESVVKTGQNKFYKTNFLYFILATAVISMFLYQNGITLSNGVYFIASIVGLGVSVLILQEKFGVDNEVSKKICDGLNTSCDSVIKSNTGEINKWVSFSDLPLLFFLTNTISLLFAATSSLFYIGLFSAVSIPVLFYSLWLQKMELKKWCALCLFVSFLILAQGIYFAIDYRTSYHFPDAYYYFLTGLIVTSFWFYTKPLIQNYKSVHEKVKVMTRFKRNSAVFDGLSKAISYPEGLKLLNGIHFGQKEANVNLILFLSPSCVHCHKAYEETKKLHAKFPEKFSFTVNFNINPENNDNPYRIVVQSMLSIYKENRGSIIEAIDDWHIKQIGLSEWLKKWEIKSLEKGIDQQIIEQYSWCLKNDFNYSPVKIINGKLFPNGYEISELQYFLNHLGESDSIEEVLVSEINY